MRAYRPSAWRRRRRSRTIEAWPLKPSVACVGTSRAAYFQLFIQAMASRTRSGSSRCGQVTAEYQSKPRYSHCGVRSRGTNTSPSQWPIQYA